MVVDWFLRGIGFTVGALVKKPHTVWATSYGRVGGWVVGCVMVGRLVGWSVGRLVGWSVGRSVGWSVGRLVKSDIFKYI